jgi:hypothetical protein
MNLDYANLFFTIVFVTEVIVSGIIMGRWYIKGKWGYKDDESSP